MVDGIKKSAIINLVTLSVRTHLFRIFGRRLHSQHVVIITNFKFSDTGHDKLHFICFINFKQKHERLVKEKCL